MVATVRPRQVVVSGRSTEFAVGGSLNPEKLSSFEFYRRSILDTEIITFDELYERARFIVGEWLKTQSLPVRKPCEQTIPPAANCPNRTSSPGLGTVAGDRGDSAGAGAERLYYGGEILGLMLDINLTAPLDHYRVFTGRNAAAMSSRDSPAFLQRCGLPVRRGPFPHELEEHGGSAWPPACGTFNGRRRKSSRDRTIGTWSSATIA